MLLDKVINNIEKEYKLIPASYDVLLDNIKEAEGGKLHYNKGETDITTSYGIYRKKHPKAIVFEYIDQISVENGYSANSKNWDTTTVEHVNSIIDPKVERYLTYLFYSKYLKNARLELFRPDMVTIMTNLYTNAPKGAWMSIQEGLRDMQKDGILKVPLNTLSGVDGSFGKMTKDGLAIFNNLKTETEFERVLLDKVFRKSVLLGMKTYYNDLVSSNPDKFVRFARGWDNRIEDLEHE